MLDDQLGAAVIPHHVVLHVDAVTRLIQERQPGRQGIPTGLDQVESRFPDASSSWPTQSCNGEGP
jgi:hypothetical protein